VGELRKINAEELQGILRNHFRWLETKGGEGHKADLSDVDLRGALLGSADLREVSLGRANLYRAFLYGADLRGVDSRDADMQKTDLRKADLRDADLSEADLSEAILRGADLRGTNLSLANLYKSDLREALLDDANLSGAFIIDTKVHSRSDLIRVKNLHPQSVSGFLFDKEDDEWVRREWDTRNARTNQGLGPHEISKIGFYLTDITSLRQVGQVLALIDFLAEGVRIALTADFESFEEFSFRVMRPELYHTQEDPFAARLTRIEMGSISGTVMVLTVVTTIILGLLKVLVKHREKTAELNILADSIEREDALAIIESPATSQALKRQAHEVIKNSFGELADPVDLRVQAAVAVVNYSATSWNAMQKNTGGEIQIDGQPFDLPDDGIIEADDYATSVDTDKED